MLYWCTLLLTRFVNGRFTVITNYDIIGRNFEQKSNLIGTYGIDSETQFLSQRKFGDLTLANEKLRSMKLILTFPPMTS